MRQIMDVSGAVLHSEREYDIAAGTSIVAGQVVKLSEGLVVAAAVAETGAILGYACEDHPGTADALNPRSNGTRILVQDAPGAIAESPAPVITATGGTATTITADCAVSFAADLFNGGYVKDRKTGRVRRITDSAVSGGTMTLTVESGDAPANGDKFVLFPPVGFSGGNLSADGRKLVLTATAALPFTVVGRDEVQNMIWTVATKHALAAAR